MERPAHEDRRPPGSLRHEAAALPAGEGLAVRGHADYLDRGEDLKNGIWPRSLPLWMAALYMALFIIRPWEEMFPLLGTIHFERIYAFLMIGVALLSRKTRFRFNSQTMAILVFFLGMGVSALCARKPELAWDPFYFYLTLVIFYFVLLSVIRTPHELVFMVGCYIVTMAVYLAKSQWEYFVHDHHRFVQGVRRLIGIETSFGGPNSLSLSIAISLPMLLFLWRVRKEFTATWPRFYRVWFPRGLVLYSFLAVSSVILTNSRSGMLGVGVFIVLTAFQSKNLSRKVSYLFPAALVLLAIWVVMPEMSRNRLITVWNPEAGPASAQSSAEGRIEGTLAGLAMFERRPLTGVGPGNFIDYRVPHVDGVPLNAHNLVGQMLGETGLVAAVPFLILVLITLRNSWKARALAERSPGVPAAILSRFTLASTCALALLAFEGLFDHNLFRYNWLWLGAFAGIALEFARREAARPAPAVEPARPREPVGAGQAVR